MDRSLDSNSMKKISKAGQLQIRVSDAQKLAIQKQAENAGMTMSEWVLSKVLPTAQANYQDLLRELSVADDPDYVFAALLDLIGAMSSAEIERVVSSAPGVELDAYWQNYLAATIEHAAAIKHAAVPSWTRSIAPLAEPRFGSSLESLRLHLLVNSPPAYARRNIFIDSSVGDRV